MVEIKTIVRDTVVTATPTTPVITLAERLRDENVGSIVIVEDDHPRGIVTDRDIVLSVVAPGRDPNTVTAEEIMSDYLTTVDTSSGIFDVLRTMEDAEVRRIPAVDDDGNLTGIVTFDDFVILLGRELRILGNSIEAEIPPYDHT